MSKSSSRAPNKVTRGNKTFTMRTGRIGTATAAKAPAAPRPVPSSAPMPSAALSEPGEPRTETLAAVSSIQSKIDAPTVPAPDVHHEEAPSVPALPTQTEDISHVEPTIPPPQPNLIDVWQQASDDERKAFVAAHRDDLCILLAAHDEPQPKQRVTASPRTSRPQPQQKQRRRAAASKRS